MNMETNSKKLMEALPDFNDFFTLAEEIKKLNLEKMHIEVDIKEKESNAFRTVMSDPQYQVGGKQPAVSYYENAYKFSGINGELLQYREHLAEITAQLDAKRTQYDIYKEMLDLFKTVVYMEKGMS